MKLTFLPLFAAVLLLSCRNPAGQAWKVVAISKNTNQVYMAGFFDENYGITVGYDGYAAYTDDSGKTWKLAKNISFCLFGLDILDRNTAWTSGNRANNRMTADGGKSWTPLADFGGNEPNHCRYISYIDAKTGWMASADMIAATADGGVTWKMLVRPKDSGKIIAIHLENAGTGYLMDDNLKIFRTADAGTTWIGIETGLVKKDYNIINARASIAIMKFSGDKGILVLRKQEPKTRFAILESADAGKTWKSETISFKAPDDKKYRSAWMHNLYLSRDWNYLTISTGIVYNNYITVLKRNRADKQR